MKLDTATYLRLVALLAAPDPPDLVGRGSHVTVAGDPKRRAIVLLPLLTRWAQTRYIALDPDPYIAPARTESELIRRLLRFQRRTA